MASGSSEIISTKSSQKSSKNSPLPCSKKSHESVTTAQYLKGVVALIIEQGIGKTRSSIFAKQLARHGGIQATKLSADATHILVGSSTKLAKLNVVLKVKEISEDIKIVRADWLSACLKEGKLVDLGPFDLRKSDVEGINRDRDDTEETTDKKHGKHSLEDVEDIRCEKGVSYLGATADSPVTSAFTDGVGVKHRKITSNDGDSDYINSDDDKTEEGCTDSGDDSDAMKPFEISPHISPHKKSNTWICTQPSSSKPENLNEHITEKLEILEKVYKNSNDNWRALGYKKAITSIKSFPKKIETLEECRSLPFVGERLANKVWEIIQTGHLQRLDHLDAKTDAMELFCNLWGAGPKTAESWVAKGLKTLDDLKEHGNLNRQQHIGLKYYEEFLERMPRNEAEEIGNVVKETVYGMDPALQCVVCGSFRRGKSTCGDVDVLVSHPDGRSHQGVMVRLLGKLKENGFLTDDLTSMENHDQRKYLGVCLLSGEGRKHRRIDIIVVPYSEWACSLIYFTGSDYLNRSMRLLARKKGMSLSEHSLNTGVVRKGQDRLTEGTPLPVSSERDVFQYLGLDYLEPHERDW